MKRLVIAGCRTYTDYEKAKAIISQDLAQLGEEEWICLSGGCRGADALGEQYAHEHGWDIEFFLPEWQRYGRAAGPIRNRQMIDRCDMVVCFWDGQSKGTASLIRMAQKANKPLFIHIIDS